MGTRPTAYEWCAGVSSPETLFEAEAYLVVAAIRVEAVRLHDEEEGLLLAEIGRRTRTLDPLPPHLP